VPEARANNLTLPTNEHPQYMRVIISARLDKKLGRERERVEKHSLKTERI
jgi:hypothetical protein